jgi:copper homeostasis protein
VAIVTEVCVDSVGGARAAARGGGDRIELCTALETGGLTPSLGLQEAVAAACGLPRHVLIRPRQGDFCYDPDEIATMTADIRAAVRAGAAAVVVGALTRDFRVDVENIARLRDAAEGASMTFHRAFDLVADQRAALDTVRHLGVQRVLSSGGRPSAAEGASRLADLVAAAGTEIAILAGAGITRENAADLVRTSGVREIHFSARRRWPPAPSPNPDIVLGVGEDRMGVTAADLVAEIVAAVGAAVPG